MSRLEEALRAARARGAKSLVPFLTGGYPDRETFFRLLFAAEACGADAVEVGLPFSDPSADGPVIQRASKEALERGATVQGIVDAVAEARGQGLALPLLFMTYFNPVLAFGPARFVGAARDAGADGVLVVDLPPEEAGELVPHAHEAGLDTVFLVAPTTPDARIPRVVRHCRGFLYCVSVTGLTGEKRPAAQEVGALVARVRRCTDLPVLVGFGVEGPETARTMAGLSDGVIVGSALLKSLDGLKGDEAVEAATRFLRSLRAAV